MGQRKIDSEYLSGTVTVKTKMMCGSWCLCNHPFELLLARRPSRWRQTLNPPYSVCLRSTGKKPSHRAHSQTNTRSSPPVKPGAPDCLSIFLAWHCFRQPYPYTPFFPLDSGGFVPPIPLFRLACLVRPKETRDWYIACRPSVAWWSGRNCRQTTVGWQG